VTQESIYRGEPSEGLAETVFEIATKAKQHLHTARSLSQEAPKEAFPAYLSAVIFKFSLASKFTFL
jgi:phytoene/squalene synthetase